MTIQEEAFKEFYKWGERAYSENALRVAINNYFKALVELCDHALLKKTGRMAGNHTQRFRMLRRHLPELFRVYDDIFTFYTKTYDEFVSEEDVSYVRKGILKAKEIIGFKED